MARLRSTLILALLAALSPGAAALAADEAPSPTDLQARVDFCRARLAGAHARGLESPEAPPGPAGTGGEPLRLARATTTSQVTRPIPLVRVPPDYPTDLRKANVEGKVVVEAILDEHGCVDEARVLESSDPGFSSAALSTVARWVFQPATFEGKPVKVYYTLTVNFAIERQAPRP